MKNQSRIYGIDTFRFCAFLNVFLFHATSQWSAGYLGVQLFFVISSFLLTFLALTEIQHTGNFSRINFFLRRAVRIYPLYFMVVAISFYALPFIAGAFGHKISLPQQQWMYWTFLSNFDTRDHLFALKFLWSVSVEEQFYLLFIVISFFFRRNIYIPIIGLSMLSFSSPLISKLADIPQYNNPLTYFSDFGIGMLAAKLYFDKQRLLSIKNLLLASFITGTLTIIAYQAGSGSAIINHSFALFAASALLLAVRCFEQQSYKRWLPAGTELFGRYTYGLYIYSGFVLTFCGMFLPVSNVFLLVSIELLMLSAIAVSSYHLFEKRFLELKNGFYVTRHSLRRIKPLITRPSQELTSSPMSL